MWPIGRESQLTLGTPEDRAALLLSRLVGNLVARWPDRSDAASLEAPLEIVVGREAARFAAWYEMFPRSQGRIPGRGASFDDCIARLPEQMETQDETVPGFASACLDHSGRKSPPRL